MEMYLGYNTNGLAHHHLEDAIRLLHEIGYRGIAITIDHGALAPCSPSLHADLSRVRAMLEEREMRCVIETGARFLLDYRRKHHPTLVSAAASDRQRRVGFLEHSINVARELGADCVSLWSGVNQEAESFDECLGRLCEGLESLAEFAASQKVKLAFEPEPGMVIDTMIKYDELQQRLHGHVKGHPIGLTLDIGHLHCQREFPIESYIERYGHQLLNVHLEDMRQGVHEHLMFGEGEMNIPSVVDVLAKSGYQGGVYVELSRHSHMGPEAAQKAFEYLKPLANWET